MGSTPAPGEARRGRARVRRLILLGASLLLVALDALWIEPRVRLRREVFAPELIATPFRVVHLSDLHISKETSLLRRLLERVAEEKPDLIAVSGDLIDDVQDPRRVTRHIATAQGLVGQLRRIAPVVAVQGHSDYLGSLMVGLEEAGLRWLSNEGELLGARPGFLLLGLSQHVGTDIYPPGVDPAFRIFRLEENGAFGKEHRGRPRNFYSHYDPSPRNLTDEGGPLSWSGYELYCEWRIDRQGTGVGVAVHSRYPLGEDRMIRFRRVAARGGEEGSLALVAHGTVFSEGRLDSRVVPQPGRWYGTRVQATTTGETVRVEARAWPLDGPEPQGWQAWAEDHSPYRIRAGTVGLWAWGGGRVVYRNLRVVNRKGESLLSQPLTGSQRPPGWRDGARGTRLELALARSPALRGPLPRVVLTHDPDVVLEASREGIELVLAGHTHGGQVRLPFHGALITRSRLGAPYDRGFFAFAAPNPQGVTWLYINAGIGTSVLPIRFWSPPTYGVVDLGRRHRPSE